MALSNKEINLLEINEQEDVRISASQKKRTQTSILIIFIFGIIFVGVIAYYTYLEKNLENLINRASAIEQEIESLKTTEEKYIFKKDKLTTIVNIIKNRPDLVPMMDLLQNATPKGISYKTINIPSAEMIVFSASADNSKVLTDYFYTLSEDSNFTKYLKEITMTSLILNKDKGYDFNLNLTLTIKK